MELVGPARRGELARLDHVLSLRPSKTATREALEAATAAEQWGAVELLASHLAAAQLTTRQLQPASRHESRAQTLAGLVVDSQRHEKIAAFRPAPDQPGDGQKRRATLSEIMENSRTQADFSEEIKGPFVVESVYAPGTSSDVMALMEGFEAEVDDSASLVPALSAALRRHLSSDNEKLWAEDTIVEGLRRSDARIWSRGQQRPVLTLDLRSLSPAPKPKKGVPAEIRF